MGVSGSSTTKIEVPEQLFHFTRYGKEEIESFWIRGMRDLSETFALRLHEFEFLVNSKLVTLPTCRYLFYTMLDTDKNNMVDKFEVMTLVCLCSTLSNEDKVRLIFELFNFNEKGYLVESEVSLMILSITTVVNKVDARWKTPSKNVWQHIVAICFKYFALIDVKQVSIRKPELVKFAANTVQVTKYLDAWRGHASQVIVKDGGMWKDNWFKCNESAIIPFNEWTNIGLPPHHFVRWRRLKHVGSIHEEKIRFLFTHKMSVLRTLDKRKLWHGPGILGNGFLVQRMLADRWFLNGIAVCLARPPLVLSLFGSTGQV